MLNVLNLSLDEIVIGLVDAVRSHLCVGPVNTKIWVFI